MRIFNRLLAFLVSVALIGVCVIVIVEVIAAKSHSGWLIINWRSMLHWGEHNTWKATSVEVASAIITAGGLLLLIPQLVRRRLTRLSIEGSENTDTALTRRGVAVTIRGAVTDVDGITGGRVKVGHRRIRVDARASATHTEAAQLLEPQVEEAASRQLEALRLVRRPKLLVAVSRRNKSKVG